MRTSPGLLPLLIALLTTAAPSQGGRYHGPGDLTPPPDLMCGYRKPWEPPPPVWQFWWEIHRLERIDPPVRSSNRHRQVQSRHAARMTRALISVLHAKPAYQLTPTAVLAIGRIGIDGPDSDLPTLLRGQLRADWQRTRETAALALGLSRRRAALDDLIALAQDTARGRRLVGQDAVSLRTRAFACFGLGLLASELDNSETTGRAMTVLVGVLNDSLKGHPLNKGDLPIAAITGLRVLEPGGALTPNRQTCLRALRAAQAGDGRSDPETRVAAHALTALARLVGREPGPEVDAARALCRRALRVNHGPDSIMAPAAILALGWLSRRHAATEDVDLLRNLAREGAHIQQRGHARMALAGRRSREDRALLLQLFRDGDTVRNGNTREDQQWAALALGWSTRPGDPDADQVTAALHGALINAEDRALQSTIAIALGLCHHRPAEQDLRSVLASHPEADELSGYVGLSLAMLNAEDADQQLIAIPYAEQRYKLEIQTLPALGLLGNGAAGESVDRIEAHLLERLTTTTRSIFAHGCSLSTGLGYVARDRTVDALLVVLADDKQTDWARAVAAAALGSIGDPRPRHWSAALTESLPYRAAVKTLTYAGSGILDL